MHDWQTFCLLQQHKMHGVSYNIELGVYMEPHSTPSMIGLKMLLVLPSLYPMNVVLL